MILDAVYAAAEETAPGIIPILMRFKMWYKFTVNKNSYYFP